MLTRRQFTRSVIYSLPPVFATAKIAAAAKPYDFVVNDVEVPIPELPERLKGVTFAQLSDLHLGIQFNNLDERQLKRVVEVVSDLKVDFVTLTGDVMDRMPFELREETRLLAGIKSRLGTFGILGNHEHYAGAPTIYHGLRKAGIDMLLNEHRLLKINDEELALMGIDTPKHIGGSHDFLSNAVRSTVEGLPHQDMPTVMMSHHPNGYYYTAAHGVDLTISGHTHGGQLVFGEFGGLRLTPAAFAFRYVKGHYEVGDTQLYVNNGLGSWMPLRVNCPPEVTRYTLV